MAAWNPEIGSHATITYITAIRKYRNVVKGAGGVVSTSAYMPYPLYYSPLIFNEFTAFTAVFIIDDSQR
jgi:hypothetical protein